MDYLLFKISIKFQKKISEDGKMTHAKHIGKRSKSRHKFRKGIRQHGMTSVNVMLQQFSKGDKVHIVANSSIHRAIPFRRFHGSTGVVEGKQGECYKVKIKDINKQKIILVHPAHLKRQK